MGHVLCRIGRLLSLVIVFVVGMKAGAEQVACLNQENGICRLVSPTVALSVTVKEGDANIQYFAPATDGFVERAHTKVATDLEARVGSGAMSEDEAAVIFSEILANPYVAYRLPPSAEALNQEVGFASNVLLSPQDQIEVLRAHLQMSLSVSAVTSRYLSDGLGLQVIEPIRPVNIEDPNLQFIPEEEPLPEPLPPPIQTYPPTERITGQDTTQTQS
jgi:hypothetical protein